MSFAVNPLDSTAAAEIVGLDCDQPLAPDVFRAVKRTFLDYPVVVIRDQVLSAAGLAAFGRQFGRLESYGGRPLIKNGGIDGIAPARSDALLAEIFALAEAHRFHYRHQWREGDLVIWDNRWLNHRVRAYPSHDIRRRHRVTIAGDRPFYLPAAAPVLEQTAA